MDKILLRVPEAAEMVGIGRSLAYELARNGEWPIVRIGRCVRIPEEALREWVARRVECTAEDKSGTGRRGALGAKR